MLNMQRASSGIRHAELGEAGVIARSMVKIVLQV